MRVHRQIDPDRYHYPSHHRHVTSGSVHSSLYPNYEQLVFSGGGIRCFWHGGFLETVREPLSLRPERVSGVSGGALSAACFIAERGEKLLRTMKEAFARNEHNVHLSPEKQTVPHQTIYRDVVSETIDEEAQSQIAEGPVFQVLVAEPPLQQLAGLSSLPVLAAYWVDLQIRSTPQLLFTRKLGIRHRVIDAREAARKGRIVELLCGAASVPPIFTTHRWGGREVIDGGLYCKAPMPHPDKGKTLVLLTRKFRNLPTDPEKTYCEVSEDTPAEKLNFTNPDKVEKTWKLGEKDGRSFLEKCRGESQGR